MGGSAGAAVVPRGVLTGCGVVVVVAVCVGGGGGRVATVVSGMGTVGAGNTTGILGRVGTTVRTGETGRTGKTGRWWIKGGPFQGGRW